MNLFAIGAKARRIAELESQVEDLQYRLEYLENEARHWKGLITEGLFESRRQIQDAIVRAFSSEQMMDWLKNAQLTAAAPDFTSLVQLAYPALKGLKPGPMNWANEEATLIAVATPVAAAAVSTDVSSPSTHTA